MQQYSDEQPREPAKKGGKEQVKQEMPQPLERLPVTARNASAAPIDGIFTHDGEYGRE